MLQESTSSSVRFWNSDSGFVGLRRSLPQQSRPAETSDGTPTRTEPLESCQGELTTLPVYPLCRIDFVCGKYLLSNQLPSPRLDLTEVSEEAEVDLISGGDEEKSLLDTWESVEVRIVARDMEIEKPE